MRCLYREKYYVCGDYLEVNLYPAFKKPGQRSKKAKPTTAVQETLNQTNAENHLARVANANFTPADIKFELTYSPEYNPQSAECAAKNLRNFFRRINRYRKKTNLPELKYIAVTERGERRGRYHHHVIMSGGILPEDIARIWGVGYVQKILPLQFDECGVTGLAKYMTKKAIYYRRWNGSKNLIRPQPQVRDGRLSQTKAIELARDTTNNAEFEKYYKGYNFAQAKTIHNDINGGVYILMRFYKKSAKLCKVKPNKKSQ